MAERRTTPSNRFFTLGVVVLAVVLLLPGSTAANPDVAVEQGDTCYELAPIGNGTEPVESYYDYRAGNGTEYSSYGTTGIQQHQTSQLYVYNGSEGASLVFLHDELGDESEGGTVSMDLFGLPSDGAWAVEDDEYPNREDTFDHRNTTSAIDWVWGPNRTDGAAFRGLTSDEFEAITIDARFNDDADRQDWTFADDEMEAWVVRDGSGSIHELDMGQNVTVRRGICDATPPAAALDAAPSTVELNQSVAFDANNSTDDTAIVAYRWDFDGDGTLDRETSEPTVTHAYAGEGSFDATVTVVDAGRNTDTASTTVTVDDPSTIDECTTINESGTYTLATDVAGGIQSECISVTASDVVLDGDGHAVEGSGLGGTVGVSVAADARLSNVTVRNLTVTGWGTGVLLRDTEASVVRNVTATGNTVGVSLDGSDGATLRSDAAADNDRGFHFANDSQAATVVDSRASGNGWGFYAEQYDGTAGFDVRNFTLSSTTVSFTGGKHVALRDVNDPPARPDGAVGVDSYVEYGRAGPDPQLSLSMWYTDAAAGGVEEPTLRLWRHDDGWSTVAAPNAVDTDGNRVTAENVSFADGHDTVVFAPLGNELVDDTPPVARADVPATTTVGESFQVDGTASSDDEGIASYEWSFGANTTATGSTAFHAYESAGTYTVSLTVTDEAGNANTTEATVTVETTASDGGDGEDGGDEGAGGSSGDDGATNGGSSGGSADSSPSSGTDGDDDATVERAAESGEAVSQPENETYAIEFQDVPAGQKIATEFPSLSVDRGTAVRMDRVGVRPAREIGTATAELVFSRNPPVDARPEGADSELASVDLRWRNGNYAVEESTLRFTVATDVFGALDTTPDRLALYQRTGDGWTALDTEVVAEGEATITYEATADRFGPYAVGIQHPAIELVDVEVDRTDPVEGDAVTVRATYENAGHLAGTTTAQFVHDGETVATREVDVPPGETRTVTFRRTVETPGLTRLGVDSRMKSLAVREGEPAIRTAAVTVDETTVDRGEPVTIRVTVENVGRANGTYTARLRLFDTVVATETVAVPEGETRTLTFTRRVEAPGEYTPAVGNASATFRVESETATTTGTAAAVRGSGPGFGLSLVVLALAAVFAVTLAGWLLVDRSGR